ncbi:MAG: DedA family protein [Candidatus Baldrarchaeia archaeon]
MPLSVNGGGQKPDAAHLIAVDRYLLFLIAVSLGIVTATATLPIFESLHFGIVEWLANFAVEVIATAGYPGVFFLMLLESALVPIPSEVIMPFSGYLCYTGLFDFTTIVLMGALGNLAGSLVAYFLGLKYGRAFIEKYGRYLLLKREVLDICERLFERYGDVIVLVSRMLPVVRTYISLPAGLGRMNLIHFIVYTFVGSVPWCILLAYIGFMLGPYWDSMLSFFRKLDIAVIVIGVMAVGYLLFRYKSQHIPEGGSR